MHTTSEPVSTRRENACWKASGFAPWASVRRLSCRAWAKSPFSPMNVSSCSSPSMR